MRAGRILGPFHILSFIFIGEGFLLIARAWPVLIEAQRQGRLATAGPYGYRRHPQYAGFVLVMLDFTTSFSRRSRTCDRR